MCSKGKILLAEDNSHTRLLVQTVLSNEGFEVIEADDGQKAVDLLTQNSLAQDLKVIFLDILMPNLNGLEVLAKIKTCDHLQSIPVIMLTTRDMAEDLIVGYNLGADYYIPKPFTRQQLVYGINLVLIGEAAADGTNAAPNS